MEKKSCFVDKFSMIWKRLLYITGFVWLCYLDHIIGSATGYIQYALKNYTGVVIALMILTAYKIKDFLKLPYFLWTSVFLLGRWLILRLAEGKVYEYGRLEASLWNVGIYGIVLLRLFYAWKVEKKYPKVKWTWLGIWLLMMAGMIFSRPDVTWTRWFLLFFGCFYVTNFAEEDLINLYSGMLEGIIVGFLLQQTCACMFRPYDMLRYEGMYSNANINALSYLLTYGAVLCKWYQMKLKRRNILWQVPIVGMVGVLFSLTFFTMGRTALISMVLLTLFFLFFQALSHKRNKLKVVVQNTVAVVLCVILCFVPTYCAVRYIPAYVDEPLFFEADMNKLEKKVQKGDSIDSDLYIGLDTVLEKSFGRLFWFLKEEPAMVVQASELKPGEDKSLPLFTREEAQDPVKVRLGIYRYYIENTKLIGRHDGVQDLWLTSGYSAPHAHNIFLHIAGEFGWIVGILFIIVIGLTYHSVLMGLAEKRKGKWYFRLFVTGVFTTVLTAFGMLEICWTFGQLPFTIFFLVQYHTFHK